MDTQWTDFIITHTERAATTTTTTKHDRRDVRWVQDIVFIIPHDAYMNPKKNGTYRWTPLHSKQKTFPKLTLAQSGFFMPQSQHCLLPGNAMTIALSCGVICTIFETLLLLRLFLLKAVEWYVLFERFWVWGFFSQNYLQKISPRKINVSLWDFFLFLSF